MFQFQDSKKTFFHGQAPGLWRLKMETPQFFSDKPEKNPFYKISSYQGFTSKQTLIWVSLLSFKNSNP